MQNFVYEITAWHMVNITSFWWKNPKINKKCNKTEFVSQIILEEIGA